VVVRATLLLAAAACSGGKAKTVEDAHPPRPVDAAAPPPPPAVAHGYHVDPDMPKPVYGDVQVRVEWKDTPQPLRAPGPPTPCKTPRAPALAPTTTWGIPDVLVAIDVDHGRAFTAPATPPRIVLEDCELTPRALVAGTTVALSSAMPTPATATIVELARPLGGPPLTAPPRSVQLPIAGHTVELALEPNTVYAIAYGTDDVAAVASAASPYVAVTDSSGNVSLRGVPIGTYPVRAYVPARAGAEARLASGTVTVTAGAVAEITLDLGRP
jgi:hypothetical protein